MPQRCWATWAPGELWGKWTVMWSCSAGTLWWHPTCMSFPSALPALPPTNTPSKVRGFPVGSCFSSVTLIIARRTGRSDSRPCWPSTTCRAAMSSHGQSPAGRRCGTVMASAVAAGPGRTSWTSKQASTADKQDAGKRYRQVHVQVPLYSFCLLA